MEVLALFWQYTSFGKLASLSPCTFVSLIWGGFSQDFVAWFTGILQLRFPTLVPCSIVPLNRLNDDLLALAASSQGAPFSLPDY